MFPARADVPLVPTRLRMKGDFMTPLESHWRLSARHYHHWASNASPAALAYGSGILRQQERWERGDYTEENLTALERAYYDEGVVPVIPPKSEAEALALSALPSGPIAGIPFTPGLPYTHTTGSGRLRWECGFGGTLLVVSRPEGDVLSAWIPRGTPEGATLWAVHDSPRKRRDPIRHADKLGVVIHAPVGGRHVWTMADALAVLGYRLDLPSWMAQLPGDPWHPVPVAGGYERVQLRASVGCGGGEILIASVQGDT